MSKSSTAIIAVVAFILGGALTFGVTEVLQDNPPAGAGVMKGGYEGGQGAVQSVKGNS